MSRGALQHLRQIHQQQQNATQMQQQQQGWAQPHACWMSVVRTPEFFFFVAFGVDEPDSSEPAKGLKEGVFQV